MVPHTCCCWALEPKVRFKRKGERERERHTAYVYICYLCMYILICGHVNLFIDIAACQLCRRHVSRASSEFRRIERELLSVSVVNPKAMDSTLNDFKRTGIQIIQSVLQELPCGPHVWAPSLGPYTYQLYTIFKTGAHRTDPTRIKGAHNKGP